MHWALRRTLGRSQRSPADAGFALIEVMVSAVLLVVLALATLPLIEDSSKSSSQSRERSMAVNIAQQDQDAMRQSPVSVLAYRHTNGPVTPNPAGFPGITFNLKSDATWVRDASGTVSCSSDSTRSEYVKITSTVTWTGMGSTAKPIVLETYIAPGVAALQRGAIAVKLAGDDGSPTSGITVVDTMPTAGAVSGTTDANGCVVFANAEAGANTISYNASNYVDPNGNQSVSKSVTVATGTTSQVNGAYDQAASVTLNFTDQTGSTSLSPKWSSVSAYNAGISSPVNGTRVFTNSGGFAGSQLVGTLYPFVTAYGYYAGSCAGNSPATYSAALPGTILPPGGSGTSVNVPLQAYKVVAVNSLGVAQGNLAVSVAPDVGKPAMAGCSESYVRAQTQAASPKVQTDNAGGVNLLLPYGYWKVCLDNGSARLTTPLSINNTPGTPERVPLTTTIGQGALFNQGTNTTSSGTGRCS